MGDFNESHSSFDEASTEQAALAKLSAIEVAQACRFPVELEGAVERGAAEFQALFDGGVVVDQAGISGGICMFFQLGQKAFTAGLSGGRNVIGVRQPGGAFAGVGQIQKAVLRSEKTGPAGDVGIADQDIGRSAFIGRPAFVRDERAERRIGHCPADGAARVHSVRCCGVFVDHLVVHGSHGGHLVHQRGKVLQVFAELYPGHGGFDGIVIRARLLRFRVALSLGVEGVDLPHAAAKPDGDDVVGLALNPLVGRIGQQGPGSRQSSGEGCGAAENFTTIDGV